MTHSLVLCLSVDFLLPALDQRKPRCGLPGKLQRTYLMGADRCWHALVSHCVMLYCVMLCPELNTSVLAIYFDITNTTSSPWLSHVFINLYYLYVFVCRTRTKKMLMLVPTLMYAFLKFFSNKLLSYVIWISSFLSFLQMLCCITSLHRR